MASAAPGTLILEPREAERLRELASLLKDSPSANPTKFCEEASVLAGALPARVRRHLMAFARTGTQKGILIVRGLPLDADLPRTPPDNSLHVGEATLPARAQAILNQCLGEMVAFEAEGGGRLFQDMVPSRTAIDSQTSLSSRVELELHTEQAFSLLRPDWVSLVCLRGNRDAATYAMSARALAAALEPNQRRMLREPLWTTGVDESFRDAAAPFAAGDLRGPFPILEGSDDDPFVRFDQDLDWGISRQAEELRRGIIELYPQLRASHVLSPGELVLLDNRRVVHGRSPFRARFDGNDRFIVRSFVVGDLGKSRYARPGNGRTIASRFS